VKLPQLEDLGDLSGKNVLVRSDLNVPLKDGVIQDDFRIRQAAETWQWLIGQGANVTVCSHLGRPEGAPDPAYSIDPVRKRAQELVPGVTVLENVRFNAGETKNDDQFTQELIKGQDAFVLDAFGSAHRSHSSVVGPAQYLPSAAGRLLAKEIEMLSPLLTGASKPFLAILGGAKVSDKIGVIDALLDKVDTMIIGGGMAYTFLKALGHEVGNSILQEDQLDYARKVLDSGKRIVLPTDIIVATSPDDTNIEVVGRDIPSDKEGFDAGPESRKEFEEEIKGAQTIFWNGPLGFFEKAQFEEGTRQTAEAVARATGTTIIGGGDVVSAVNQFGLADKMDWVSTGGGAALELIEKGDLPGLVALREAASRG
jgi:phosphoglycerate kinase